MAAINPLNWRTDVICDVLTHCPKDDFIFLAGVNKAWKVCWVDCLHRPSETNVTLAAETEARTDWTLALDDVAAASFWGVSRLMGGVFCVMARAGNLRGLQAAAREVGMGWSSQDAARQVQQVGTRTIMLSARNRLHLPIYFAQQ